MMYINLLRLKDNYIVSQYKQIVLFTFTQRTISNYLTFCVAREGVWVARLSPLATSYQQENVILTSVPGGLEVRNCWPLVYLGIIHNKKIGYWSI